MTLTMPAVSVQISDSGPWATPTWYDISAYCLGFNTSSGRQHELNHFESSSATITLSNNDGRFSSWGSSKYGTAPTIGNPVKITATESGTTYPVYYGYISSVEYSQTSPNNYAATLKCYDGLKLLSLKFLASTKYAQQILANGATSFWRLGDAIGSTTAIDSGPHGYNLSVQGTVNFGSSSPLVLDDTSSADFSTSGLNSCWTTNTSAGVTGTVYSFEAWVNFSSAPSAMQYIWCQRNSITGGEAPTVSLFVTTSGQIGLNVYDTNGNQLGYVQTATSFADGTWHLVQGVRNGTTIYIYVDAFATINPGTSVTGTLSTNFSTPAPAMVLIGQGYQFGSNSFGGSIGDVSVFNGIALTSTELRFDTTYGLQAFDQLDTGRRFSDVLDIVGVPSAQVVADTGLTTCLAPTAADNLAQSKVLTYLQQVENTEVGYMFQDPSGNFVFRNRAYATLNSTSNSSQITLTDNDAQGTGYIVGSSSKMTLDDEDVWNEIIVQAISGNPQTVENTSSQALVGLRSLSGFTRQLFVDSADSLYCAQWLASRFAEAILRVQHITLSSTTASGALLIQMLERKFIDRVTVYHKPLDGTNASLSQDYIIEGISHKVTPDEWQTTWALAPVDAKTYFILDNASLGVLDTDALIW